MFWKKYQRTASQAWLWILRTVLITVGGLFLILNNGWFPVSTLCNFWISYWKAQRQGSGSGGLFVIEFTPTHKRPKKLKRGLGNTFFLVEDLVYPPSFDILLCRSYIVTLHSFKVQYTTCGCSNVLSLCHLVHPDVQGLSDGLQKCARAHSTSIRFLF
jgi:hypothetical protein